MYIGEGSGACYSPKFIEEENECAGLIDLHGHAVGKVVVVSWFHLGLTSSLCK